MVRCLLALVTVLLAGPSMASEPVALHCARGSGEYPDAAMTLSERGAHVVDVTFVGYRPTRSRADWSLRDCLHTASKLDATHDIDAHLWYRDRAPQSRPQPLDNLLYKSASRRVVHPLGSLPASSSGLSSSAGTR